MTPPAEPITPLRIFIVEDHDDTLGCLTFYLEEKGHTILAATGVEDALAKLPAADCDILLSDIGLPDGTGWDLMQRLQLPRPIYAIAMSGFGMSEDHRKSAAAGFRHHLLKPLTPSRLDTLLATAAREISRPC